MSSSMPVVILEWKPLLRNTLQGFAKIRLGKSMSIRDVAIHTKDGKRWAALPSKPVLDQQGNVKRQDNGKPAYVPMIEWLDRDAADRFSDAVVAAMEAQHPGALGG